MGTLFAEGKGFGYVSNVSEPKKIRDLNQFYGLTKWGWVIYRCTYGDDDAWARFLERFNNHLAQVLREDYQMEPEFFASYECNVQEDPSGLDGATKDEVRRRFRQLRESLVADEIPTNLEDFKKQAAMRENPRFNYCIHVDTEALEQCLQPLTYVEGTIPGHVNLVRADKDWRMPDFDRFDWDKHESEKQKQESGDGQDDVEAREDDDEDDYDEGEPEIEGSRLFDVGWMKVKVETLLPEMYETLIRAFLWDRFYCRPPEVLDR